MLRGKPGKCDTLELNEESISGRIVSTISKDVKCGMSLLLVTKFLINFRGSGD